jgi:myosin-crossreactive antigen
MSGTSINSAATLQTMGTQTLLKYWNTQQNVESSKHSNTEMSSHMDTRKARTLLGTNVLTPLKFQSLTNYSSMYLSVLEYLK